MYIKTKSISVGVKKAVLCTVFFCLTAFDGFSALFKTQVSCQVKQEQIQIAIEADTSHLSIHVKTEPGNDYHWRGSGGVAMFILSKSSFPIDLQDKEGKARFIIDEHCRIKDKKNPPSPLREEGFSASKGA
ncbi:hypothetical protein L4C42_00530 [Vibrio wakamikoensis]|uniref:C-type lysozyme inhibitor domain-containing protein n=1 Tax=Vibrio chaetopteri TaxID=3016528 RepID=A0AAU8BNF3_9VIBR